MDMLQTAEILSPNELKQQIGLSQPEIMKELMDTIKKAMAKGKEYAIVDSRTADLVTPEIKAKFEIQGYNFRIETIDAVEYDYQALTINWGSEYHPTPQNKSEGFWDRLSYLFFGGE